MLHCWIAAAEGTDRVCHLDCAQDELELLGDSADGTPSPPASPAAAASPGTPPGAPLPPPLPLSGPADAFYSQQHLERERQLQAALLADTHEIQVGSGHRRSAASLRLAAASLRLTALVGGVGAVGLE